MSEFVSGNLFIRPMEFTKAGEVVAGHKHNFDHTTYVVRGALRIEKVVLGVNGEVVEVLKTIDKRATDGHNWILIQAGTCHRITALEDNTLGHCLYAHRNPQGEVVQEYDGWREGYV